MSMMEANAPQPMENGTAVVDALATRTGMGAGDEPLLCAVCSDAEGVTTPCCHQPVCGECLGHWAASSKRLFRCPFCKDEERFTAFATELGVRLEPNKACTFVEEVVNPAPACAEESCRCPRGRRYDADERTMRSRARDASWALVPCSLCGQSWVHAGCRSAPSFVCGSCTPEEPRDDAAAASVGVDDGAPAVENPFAVGDAVEARWAGGQKYYAGRVLRCPSAAACAVRYDDGDVEDEVPVDWMRALAPRRREARPRRPDAAARLDAAPHTAERDAARSAWRDAARWPRVGEACMFLGASRWYEGKCVLRRAKYCEIQYIEFPKHCERFETDPGVDFPQGSRSRGGRRSILPTRRNRKRSPWSKRWSPSKLRAMIWGSTRLTIRLCRP